MFDKAFFKFALGFAAIIALGVGFLSLSGHFSKTQATASVKSSETTK